MTLMEINLIKIGNMLVKKPSSGSSINLSA